MTMAEDEKQLYLDVLREGSTPFDRFVARGDIEDVIDIPTSRKIIDRTIYRAISQTQLDQSTRLIPILGEAGSGKTHAYHAYKDREHKIAAASKDSSDVDANFQGPTGWTIIYVPSPPASIRILLHVYTCMLEELGADILNTVSDKLIDRWGGKKKKWGIFGKSDIEEIIQNGIREYPGVFADAVKAMVLFQMDKDRRTLAERWLLGEDLDETELSTLGISSVVEEDDICLAMIKLIAEHTDRTLILYFDELESPYRMHGEEAERKFLEVLKRMYNEVKNLIIIIAVLKEIWPRILEIADTPLRSRMEPEHELQKWTLDDLKLFFARSMQYFWTQNNLNPPPLPLFPLNDQILSVIYNKTDGNQRSIIKLIRIFVDKIVMGDMTIEELMKDEKIKPTAQPVAKSEIDDEIKKMAANAVAQAQAKKTAISKEIDKMMQEESFIIEVNSASIAGAALKVIKQFAEKYNKNAKVDIEYQFVVGKRATTVAGLVTYENRRIALELPSVKTYDKSGGVAAFYAASRCQTAFEQKVVDEAILIVPKDTSGQKFQSILKQYPTMHMIEINNEEGEALLRGIASNIPTAKAYEIGKLIFPDLPDFVPPKEEPKQDQSKQ
jgi:hypothetical protein